MLLLTHTVDNPAIRFVSQLHLLRDLPRDTRILNRIRINHPLAVEGLRPHFPPRNDNPVAHNTASMVNPVEALDSSLLNKDGRATPCSKGFPSKGLRRRPLGAQDREFIGYADMLMTQYTYNAPGKLRYCLETSQKLR